MGGKLPIKGEHLQFYGLVPHYDVSRQDEGLDVDDVSVPAFGTHIQPFTLERQVAERDAGSNRVKDTANEEVARQPMRSPEQTGRRCLIG